MCEVMDSMPSTEPLDHRPSLAIRYYRDHDHTVYLDWSRDLKFEHPWCYHELEQEVAIMDGVDAVEQARFTMQVHLAPHIVRTSVFLEELHAYLVALMQRLREYYRVVVINLDGLQALEKQAS